jgi:hypothetical protein
LVRAIPGSTVSIPVSVAHTGTVSAVQFDLGYPAAKLTAGAFQGGPLSNNIVLRSRQLAAGQERILLYTTDLSLLPTNTSAGGLPFSLPAGDLSGGGRVTISNALASTRGATPVTPLGLQYGAVLTGPVARGSDGVVDLFLIVQSNRTYVIQATTNLVKWVNLSTNFALLDYIVYQDRDAVNYAMRFYRAVPLAAAGGGLIESLALHAGGYITFAYPSVPGHSYVLQVSTNLVGWLDAATNLAGALSVTFTNLVDRTYPRQFFRVVERP